MRSLHTTALPKSTCRGALHQHIEEHSTKSAAHLLQWRSAQLAQSGLSAWPRCALARPWPARAFPLCCFAHPVVCCLVLLWTAMGGRSIRWMEGCTASIQDISGLTRHLTPVVEPSDVDQMCAERQGMNMQRSPHLSHLPMQHSCKATHPIRVPWKPALCQDKLARP